MPQEGLELCDGVDAAPPTRGLAPVLLHCPSSLPTHCLFGRCQRRSGVISLSLPLPDIAFLLSPIAGVRNHSHAVNVMHNTPRFCPPGATSESLSPSPAAPWCS